jgi:hypothetical protein
MEDTVTGTFDSELRRLERNYPNLANATEWLKSFEGRCDVCAQPKSIDEVMPGIDFGWWVGYVCKTCREKPALKKAKCCICEADDDRRIFPFCIGNHKFKPVCASCSRVLGNDGVAKKIEMKEPLLPPKRFHIADVNIPWFQHCTSIDEAFCGLAKRMTEALAEAGFQNIAVSYWNIQSKEHNPDRGTGTWTIFVHNSK